MNFKKITLKNQQELQEHIKTHQPTFFSGSKTSTVVPYSFLEEKLRESFPGDRPSCFYLADLSQMPSRLELTDNGNLKVCGAVSWQEASQFLQSQGRVIKTYPTESLAQITAGVATSCTGERCFGFGTLRDQVLSLKYINAHGEEISLSRDKKLKLPHCEEVLQNYQKSFAVYEGFKNAPFPRFEKETDLMIGTEGQLGVVTEVVLETAKDEPLQYLFIRLPRWEKDFEPHLQVFSSVQSHRDYIYSCELVDYNSMLALEDADRLLSKGEQGDVIFLELVADQFENFYAEVVCSWSLVDENSIFEVSEEKFKKVRAAIPRTLFERNSERGILKKGTDVQVSPASFKTLLEYYRFFAHQATENGLEYNLFGHFGDAHLHFNFLPQPEQQKLCDEFLLEFYSLVKEWGGSPFAEHGIGLLKQPFIKPFLSDEQFQMFSALKKVYDPYHQFFPQGFMSIQGEQ